MRNSYPSELSIRSNSDTWIDNLDNFGQKRKTLEMDKRLSEDLPTTPSVVISGNIVTTKEPSEQTVNLSQNKMDQSEKRELSRTRGLTDPPQGGASTSTHTPVIEQAKTDSHSQQCLTKPSKDSKTTQSTVTDNVQMSKSVAEETQTKTVTYGVESSGTEALPSLCPQTLIKQCPENQQAYPQQMRHVNAQAPLPTEAKIIGTQPTGDLHTKRFQADVRHGNEKETSCEEKTDNVIKQSTKLQDHISSSSHIKPSADGQCTIDAAGASAVLDIASEQTTTKTTMAETCKQEEKQTSVHPGPKTVDSDLCQEAPSDHEKTSQTCSRKRDPVSHDPHENHPGVSRTETPGTLTKTCSPNSLPHNLGTQAGARVEYKSVAVSPIVPPGTLSTFTFQTQVGKRASSSPQGSPKGPPGKKIARTVDTMAKAGSFELAPPQQEVGSEAGIRVECKSVAISPIVPTDGTPLFTFQAGKGELWSTAVKDQHTGKDPRSIDMLSKTPSFEVTPPQQDIGTQAGTRVECISVANSPIIPPEGTSSFSFQDDKRREVLSSSKKSSSGGDQTRGKENRTLDALAKTSSFELTPPQQDFGSQAGTRVECRSVAVSPFIPPDGTSSFSFQEDKSKNHSSLDRSSADEDKSKKKEARTCDMLPKTGSFELTPPQQDATSQAGNRVECISVANSPIVFPSDGSVSFTFQSNKGSQQATPEKCSSAEDQTRGMEAKAEGTRSKNCCHEFPPPQKDMETQADSKVECKSVALSPFVLSDGPSTFTFQAKTTESKCQEQSKPTGVRTMDTISKTCLFELTPPQQDEATQVDTRVECKSVAVSPIIPPDGSTTFTFQKEKSLQGSPSRKETFTNQTRATDTFSKTYSFELTPPQQDEGTQVDTRVECKSVAVSPIIPPDGSTAFTFQAEKKQHGSPSLETQVSKNAAVSKGTSFGDGLTKTCSVELTPTHQHVGTETRVECTSVAVSPIIPPDGTSSFSFQADTKKQSLSPKSTSSRGRDAHPLNSLSKTCSLEVTPPQQDVGTQAGSRVECKSAAVSPIIPPGESSSFPFSADSAPQESSSQISFSVPESDRREARNLESLPKDVSFEITPPQQDVGVQVDTLVQCVHMAVSPIVPPDGCTSFHFQSEAGGQGQLLTSADPKLAASRKDAELQVSIYAETRSVATGPMTPLGKSPRTSYPEVHVKGTKGEPSEPVREVSWDEKGMTWEVYGASMEVEVLGMAIQKHLEKQIEEHGRQKVMTPQNTRASSIRGAPVKGDPKRPPSIFRAMLHNMRRPRCCSRAGPAPE